jgi:hypothetical protein
MKYDTSNAHRACTIITPFRQPANTDDPPADVGVAKHPSSTIISSKMRESALRELASAIRSAARELALAHTAAPPPPPPPPPKWS